MPCAALHKHTLTFALILRLTDAFRLFVNSLWVWHLTAVDQGPDGCVVIKPHHVTYETMSWSLDMRIVTQAWQNTETAGL